MEKAGALVSLKEKKATIQLIRLIPTQQETEKDIRFSPFLRDFMLIDFRACKVPAEIRLDFPFPPGCV